MTIEEIKKYLKKHKINYDELSLKSNIPLNTLKNIFSGRTPNPRIDTMQAIEDAIEKIKISNGDYPIDIEEFERITKNNELARKISELPPDLQEALFIFIDKTIETTKK